MPSEPPVDLNLKPCNPKGKDLKYLARYIRARRDECAPRRSICHCLYADYYCHQLDDDPEDRDWGSQSVSGRAHADLLWHRSACETLFNLVNEDKIIRCPYLAWTSMALKTSLQQRGVALPRPRNKSNYIKALLQADDERIFRFMDLPPEIRSIIYESALQVDKKEPDRSAQLPYKDLQKPALLETCREVRQEATAIFFRINRFFLRTQENSENRFLPKSLYLLLNHSDRHNVQYLHHITLMTSYCAFNYRHLIDIDLHCRDPRNWAVRRHEGGKPLIYGLHIEQEPFPLKLQEIEYGSIPESQQSPDVVNVSISIARKAIDKLWETCGHGRQLRVTVAALSDLFVVVEKILEDLYEEE